MSRQKIIGVFWVVVIVGSAAWLFNFYKSGPAAGESVAFRRPAVCEACGESYVATFGRAPARCEKCGAEALWHAMQCANGDCGAMVPVLAGDARPGKAPTCPKCGGESFREVRPDDLQ